MKYLRRKFNISQHSGELHCFHCILSTIDAYSCGETPNGALFDAAEGAAAAGATTGAAAGTAGTGDGGENCGFWFGGTTFAVGAGILRRNASTTKENTESGKQNWFSRIHKQWQKIEDKTAVASRSFILRVQLFRSLPQFPPKSLKGWVALLQLPYQQVLHKLMLYWV